MSAGACAFLVRARTPYFQHVWIFFRESQRPLRLSVVFSLRPCSELFSPTTTAAAPQSPSYHQPAPASQPTPPPHSSAPPQLPAAPTPGHTPPPAAVS